MRDLERKDSNGVIYNRVKTTFSCILLLFAVCSVFVLHSCQNTASSDKAVEEIRTGSGISNADLIRNPVSAETPGDTLNMPKIVFDQTAYDFGDITDDKIVSHVFSFVNTGKTPLVIAHARGTCGCTVPEWPKNPVPPGGKGEIEVHFDPSGKEGQQHKPVIITANTYPNTTNIFISARVKPKTDQ